MEVLWDPTKARGNLAKHGLAFEDAELALSDPRALTREDSDSRGQQRFVTVGADALGRVVVVVFAHQGGDIRLISARRATRKEQEHYARRV